MVSRPCDASTSSEIGENSTDRQTRHHNNDSDTVDSESEVSEDSPPKRAKTVSEYKLSAEEIDTI